MATGHDDDGDEDDDDDDDHCNTGLRTAQAGARDSSDRAPVDLASTAAGCRGVVTDHDRCNTDDDDHLLVACYLRGVRVTCYPGARV